jgi:protein tyrosine/serine phosphatase
VLVREREEVQALPRGLTAERVLDWEGLHNARDLAGLRTADGRRIRRGALVRSDLVNRLTDTGKAAVRDYGIRSVVDLRFKSEVAHDWDSYPFRDSSPDGIRHVNVPFDLGRDPSGEQALMAGYIAARTRSELNRLDVDWNVAGVGAAVATIAEAPSGGVLVHCHGGKDRTGMVVGLILSVLGVDDETIADDYAQTSENLEPLIVEWLDANARDDAERQRLRGLATPTREAMLDTLSYLRERHGSVEAYLRAGGVTDEHLALLRERLLEPA